MRRERERNRNRDRYRYGYDNIQHDHCESIARQNFDCPIDRKVIKHQHVIRHQHDIINEYDVVHEHVYNYYDVVKTREVPVKHNDHRKHKPNYCGEKNCRDEF